MANKPETIIANNIVRALKRHQVWVIKLPGRALAGVPDLMCVWEGLAFFLEVKQPGHEPRPVQLHRIETLQNYGAHAACVTSVTEALDELAKLRCYDKTRRYPKGYGAETHAEQERQRAATDATFARLRDEIVRDAEKGKAQKDNHER